MSSGSQLDKSEHRRPSPATSHDTAHPGGGHTHANATDLPTTPKWHLSPYKYLHKRNCPCTTSGRKLRTAEAVLRAQLGRLEKVWRRLTSAPFPSELADAGTRLLLALRMSGLEQFHFMAREVPTSLSNKRKDHSILLLVRSSDATSGHRWVGEIRVQLFNSGSRSGKIDMVETRQAEDWDDWTRFHDPQYFEISGDVPLEIDIPDEQESTAAVAVERVWIAVCEMLGGDDPFSKRGFARMINRVNAEIASERKLISGYSVAMRFRNGSSGKGIVPCIMVSVFATPANPRGDSEAVIMIDPNGTTGKIKSMMVMYHGCSPVAHAYRMDTLPPRAEEWAGVVKGSPKRAVGEHKGGNSSGSGSHSSASSVASV